MERDGTESESPTTGGVKRGAAGGGRETAEAAGLGASQVPSGTREAAAAPPTAVVRKVVPDEDKEADGAAEGRGAEGTVGFGGVGTAVLRIAVMSTFPTGV